MEDIVPPPSPPPPPQPPTSDLQKDQEVIKQLTKRWKDGEARALNLFREQEESQRFLNFQSHQSHRRNEDLRSLNRDNRRLADMVHALEKSIGGQQNTPAPAPAIKNKKKKASSQSSFDPTTKELPQKELPPAEAPKELPPIPQLDLGCRFVPTDQELIVCLRKKMLGEPLPKFIIERDLYGSEEPKHLFKNNPTASEMYFFTPIKVKFDSGKRADRIVGSGTWKLQNNRDVYDNPTTKKTVVGCKRTLNFIETQAAAAAKEGKSDSWIMHEYILKEKDQGRWAVCRVKRGRGNFVGLSAPSPKDKDAEPPSSSLLPAKKPADQSSGKNTDDLLELDLKL